MEGEDETVDGCTETNGPKLSAVVKIYLCHSLQCIEHPTHNELYTKKEEKKKKEKWSLRLWTYYIVFFPLKLEL